MILPTIHQVTRVHTHWIIWSIIAFMLLSEWPKATPPAASQWQRLCIANKSIAIGLLVFVLSGILGFILFFRSPLPAANAFQSLMPAFIGLFTLPALLSNIWARTSPPKQETGVLSDHPTSHELRLGALAGILGGSFASFIPVITGGIGGMLAGHATALRSRNAFLVSQGAAKTIYYVGGLLLFFVPNLYLARGGSAAILKSTVSPYPTHLYWMVAAAAIFGGGIALIVLPLLMNKTIRVSEKWGYRQVSILSATLVAILVYFFSGFAGLGVMSIATGIGLMPILYGTRRMNALGVILLPIACSMSGIAPKITQLLLLP
jgi:putative membrane protein